MCTACIEQGREEARDKRCFLMNWLTYVLPHGILRIHFALCVYLILSTVFLY